MAATLGMLGTLLLLPSAGSAQTVEDLTGAREDLQDARERLEAAQAAVDRTERELAAIDDRLNARLADLHEIEQALAVATAEELRLRAETQRIEAELSVADTELAGVVTRWEASRDSLETKVITAYKRGSDPRAGAFITLFTGVDDLHAFVVNRRALMTMIDEDVRMTTELADLSGAVAAQRREVAVLREEARTRQRHQARATRAVEQLVDRQRLVVAAVAEERAAKATVLATFEADRDAARQLVATIASRISELTIELNDAVAAQYAAGVFDEGTPNWVFSLPQRGQDWAAAVTRAAVENRLDPRLFASLVWAESAFYPAAVSHAGAIGLAQLMPGTAAGMGVDPWDPVQNLQGGARYLRAQLDTFGAIDLALAAYNAGPGAVQRYSGIPPYTETQFYVLRVLGYYEKLIAADG